MPGETGVTVVIMLVCFLILHARLRVHRAPGIPCALRLRRAGGFWKKLARNCAARSRSRCCKQRCLKLNPWQLTEREGDLPVIPRESGVSSTLQPFGSITDAGGILDRPLSRAMTVADRMRARRSFYPSYPAKAGVSSTPRLFGSITDAGGILDRPLSRAMTVGDRLRARLDALTRAPASCRRCSSAWRTRRRR